MIEKSTVILSKTIFLILAFFRKAQERKLNVANSNGITEMNPNILRQIALTAVLFFSSTVLYAQTATQTIVFNNTGATQSFKVPLGVTSITVEAWGGGGAGGGGNTNTARGAGGGAGYTKVTLAVTSGNTYTVNVGQGGLGSSNPGGSGTASSLILGATTVFSANGGAGGSNGTGGAGGAVGLPAAGTGLVRFAGGAGGTGNRHGGGGGGSAGTGGNGGAGGNATAPLIGSGNPGNGGAAGSGTGGNPGAAGGIGGERTGSLLTGFDPNPGVNGSAPGAGGGGRSAGSNTTNVNGGNGADGKLVITYVVNVCDLKVVKTVSNDKPGADDVITFTIVATNKKATAANDVVVTDILPSGYTFISANQSGYDRTTGEWNVGSIAASGTTTLTITALVNSSGTYNNTATILSNSSPDENTTDNTSTVNVTLCQAGIVAPLLNN